MFRTTLVLLVLTAAAALSGCADDPPSGEFTLAPGPMEIQGTVEVSYQEFNDPLNLGDSPSHPACQNRPPEVGQDCVAPESRFSIDFSEMPAADPSQPYTAYFVGSEGEMEIGTLQETETGFGVNQTFDQYLGADANAQVEVRLGDVAIATAPATAGIQDFQVAQGIQQVTGEGSYDGTQFTVNVAGLPANGTYMGWFVENGSEHVVSFTVTEGENTYETEQNVATYDAFHIHVAGSKINIAVADLTDA